MGKEILIDKIVEASVAAEMLRDKVKLYDASELRYVDGKIEVPVGFWAW